jgi:glycosyltransferase involved in cell wall biosynthesis
MLQVCHILSGDLWAGAEVMAFTLLKKLKEVPSLKLQVILLNDGRLLEELRAIGLNPYVFDEKRLSSLQLFLKIRKLVSQLRPQIIHSHRYKENILAYFTRKRGTPTRLVSTQHGLPERHSLIANLYSFFVARLNEYVLARHFDQLIAVSSDIRKSLLARQGFDPERVSVIHNGIELNDLRAACSRGSELVVGSCGRLVAVKDFSLFVEIAKAAVKQKAPLRFELAGEGPERLHLEDLAVKYGLGAYVRFRGHLDNMASFYRDLGMYMNTSVHEGIPLSILEAMSWKLPVVAPKVGGLTEIISDGVDGFLVDGRDPLIYAERCMKIQKDPKLRQRLGNAAREKIVRYFSDDSMAYRYENLYRKVAA